MRLLTQRDCCHRWTQALQKGQAGRSTEDEGRHVKEQLRRMQGASLQHGQQSDWELMGQVWKRGQ